LGEAGAGKSTLLRQLAWEWAGDLEAPLPLLVPLGRADALISQTGCSLLEAALDLLTEHKAGEERELLKQALLDAIGGRKALFLCDGLDEAHLARRSVVAGLEKLAADGQRLVVTSRPLGYERMAALKHFQVLPLLPEDAQAFSDRWFLALAQARGVPEAEQEEWARERADWLQRQLDERPGLREVARNPLLLTFLAVLAGDDPQRDLPHRRKELYQEYVERLFTVWEARRRQEGELSLGKLRGEEARRVALWGLYHTAWHLHRAYHGDDEGPQAVREEIEPLLACDLRKRWEIGTLEAEALAAEVLRFWEGAGLLDVYRLAGQEWLAFRHLTFQEYGAARTLSEMYENDADGLWQCLSPYLLSPQWTGVISLTLAHLSVAQATTLVERLLAANEDDEDLQRPLFLAAAALAEGTEVADAPHRQVVDALLDLARTRHSWEWGQKASAMDAVNALDELRQVDDLLLLAWGPTADVLARVFAVGALEKLERVDDLLALTQNQMVSDRVRLAAAKALSELGRIDDLLALAQDQTLNDGVRLKAAYAFKELGCSAEAAELFLALAQAQTMNDGVRLEAVDALSELGREDKAAETWLALARDQTVNDGVRLESASALWELEREDEAGEAWLTIARDPEMEARMRKWAAEALEKLGRGDDLLALAKDQTVDDWVREWAAEALGKLGRTKPEVLAELRALAAEPGTPERVRRAAREALARLEG
jgi:hypothetical protein